MKKSIIMLMICSIAALSLADALFSEELIKKFARPGPQPKLYYSGIMVGKTYYVAGSGDGRPQSPDESYREKTRRCFASIQRSLKMADLDLIEAQHV